MTEARRIHEAIHEISAGKAEPLTGTQQALLAWAMKNHEGYEPCCDDLFFTGSMWEFLEHVNQDSTNPYSEEDIRQNPDMFIIAPMGIIAIVF